MSQLVKIIRELDPAFRADVSAGLTQVELARKYRVSRGVISNVCNEFSLQPRKGSYNKPTFSHDEAIRLREQGLSFRNIGAQLGVSNTVVRDAILRKRPDLLGWRSNAGAKDKTKPALIG